MYFQSGGAVIFPLLLAGHAWGQGNVVPLPLNILTSPGSTSGLVSSTSISPSGVLPTPPQNIVLQDDDDDDDDDDDNGAQISTTQPLVTVSTAYLNGSTASAGPSSSVNSLSSSVSVSASLILTNPTGGAAYTSAVSAVFTNTTLYQPTSTTSRSFFATGSVLLPVSGSGTGGAAPTGPATGAPFSNTTSAVQTSASSQNSGAVPIVTGIGIGTAPSFGTGTGGAAPTGPATGAPFSNTTSAVQTSASSQNSGAASIVTGIGVGTAPGSGTGTGTGGLGLPIASTNPPFGNNTATTAGSGAGTKTLTTTFLQTSTVVSVSGGQTITKEVVSTVVQEVTITKVGAVTTTESTIATETATVTSPIIIIVQQVTLFIFNSALGCLPPAVVPNNNVPGSFIVGLQPFPNLPSACSAACNHQLSVCVSLVGPAISVVACQVQFTACIKAAQQASTVTQITGVPVPSTINQTVVLPPQAVTSNTVGNMISNAGGSIITTETLAASAVATVGDGGVSIITPTQTNPVQMTPILTTIVQTLPPETYITTSIATVTIGDDDDDDDGPKVQLVTKTVTMVSPAKVTSIATNVLAPQVPGDITGVAASNGATDAANPVTDTTVLVGAPATVTETLMVTVTVSDCASTVTLATCPGSSSSSLPSLSSASYISPSSYSNSASDTLTTVTISTASATPTTPSGDDDDDDGSQNSFRSAIRSLLGKRSGPSRSRIMRGRA